MLACDRFFDKAPELAIFDVAQAQNAALAQLGFEALDDSLSQPRLIRKKFNPAQWETSQR